MVIYYRGVRKVVGELDRSGWDMIDIFEEKYLGKELIVKRVIFFSSVFCWGCG